VVKIRRSTAPSREAEVNEPDTERPVSAPAAVGPHDSPGPVGPKPDHRNASSADWLGHGLGSHLVVVVVVCGGDVVVVVDDDVVVVAGWDGSTVVGEASSRSGATTMARSGLGDVDGVAAIVVLVWSGTTSGLNAVAGGLGPTLSLLGGAAMASIAGSVGPLVSIRVGSPIAC
jgi:hypothetical protein